ncbi:MAG: hypothetical protein AAGC53_11250 [Actinomycetota bacterium]
MSNNARHFKRQLFGYRRRAVDEHLAVVDASIADLREAVEAASRPEHHDLVLRATRLAVEDVLQRAHNDAEKIRSDAETEAARMLADAYEIVAARESVIDLRPTTEPDEPVIDTTFANDLARAIED